MKHKVILAYTVDGLFVVSNPGNVIVFVRDYTLDTVAGSPELAPRVQVDVDGYEYVEDELTERLPEAGEGKGPR